MIVGEADRNAIPFFHGSAQTDGLSLTALRCRATACVGLTLCVKAGVCKPLAFLTALRCRRALRNRGRCRVTPETIHPARQIRNWRAEDLFSVETEKRPKCKKEDQQSPFYTSVSSSKKSVRPTLSTPFSSYQRLRISWRTMIFGKESPVSEKGLFSAAAFSSVSIAQAD